MLLQTKNSPYAKAFQPEVGSVVWTDGFWRERVELCAEKSVENIRNNFESMHPCFHVIENFRIATGDHEGEHIGTAFGDGDLYKWLEAATYASILRKDTELQKHIDEYLDLIIRTQGEDGYISTAQIISEKQSGINIRQSNINAFEEYNLGHLMTSACVHYRLTNNDCYLKVAEKAAVYLDHMYKEAEKADNVQTAVCAADYMGLVELYRTTGKREYLETADMAIKLRDKVKNGIDDNQDRIKLLDHQAIHGHAVRATYLYAGVCDVYLENGDKRYLRMLNKVWNNLKNTKIYITGGCGALYNGGSPYGLLTFKGSHETHQAFGYEYQLPNITAYNETCATIGNLLWNHRMFCISPEAKFFDMIERGMHNLVFAALSFEGTEFFYENMLQRTKSLDFDVLWPLNRQSKITGNQNGNLVGGYCCPPNIVRTIMSSSEFAYMCGEDCVWTGLYGDNQATLTMKNGTTCNIRQKTGYPYDGGIHFDFTGTDENATFTLHLRVPSWVTKGFYQIGAQQIEITPQMANQYITLQIAKDEILAGLDVYFDMTARMVMAHHKVEEDKNCVAVMRGPLVYCMETPDIDIDTLDDVFLPTDATFTEESYEMRGRQVVALHTDVCVANYADTYDPNALYQPVSFAGFTSKPARMIPYFAWDNRGFGEMKIWHPMLWRG